MPTTIVSIRVPDNMEDYYRHKWYQEVYENAGDPLFLHIRENPTSTIDQVRRHFPDRKKKTIINMCYKTGLVLQDLPKKKVKRKSLS